MFQGGNLILPSSALARGTYLFGLQHGIITLANMQHGDSHEIERSQLANDGILTFEPHWSRPIRKRYLFKALCPELRIPLQELLERDLAAITRFWSHELVEYGFFDPSQTRIINMRNGTVDFELSLISLFEVKLRETSLESNNA